MAFKDKLNGYMELIGCNNIELSKATGLSAPAISRYRNGSRVPNTNSSHIAKLSNGIASLSHDLPADQHLDEAVILDEFKAAIGSPTGDYETFLANLNRIISALELSNAEIASTTHLAPSFVSRILNGKRHPADFQQFTDSLSRYIASRFAITPMSKTIAKTIGCDEYLTRNENACAFALNNWFNSRISRRNNAIGKLLETIDSFSMEDYEQHIRNSDEHAAANPQSTSVYKIYTGSKGIKQADLDFLTVASEGIPSNLIFMYSDMPRTGIVDDRLFTERFQTGLASVLKRGTTINVLHNTDRDVEEVLESFERWIPLYMTGKVFPYCFKEKHSGSIFNHSLKVADNVAVEGEAIANDSETGRFILTQIPEDVAYLRNRSTTMLKHARPLVQIFHKEQSDKAAQALRHIMAKNQKLRIVCGDMPPFTLDNQLTLSLLKHNQISAEDCLLIQRYIDNVTNRFESLLTEKSLVLEIPEYGENDFNSAPIALGLTEIFYEKPISYTYEEYRRHVELTEMFAANHPSCIVKHNTSPTFRNIHVSIFSGSCVIISKLLDPSVHIMIDHPDLVPLFEQFVVPVSK